jgi:transcriptional regulator with XRE-family HTH domain
LATNVRRLRRDRGLTLGALAKLSDVAKATLSKIEGGTANPTLSTISALADAFSTSVEALLAPESPPLIVVRNGDGVNISDSSIRGRTVHTISEGSLTVEVFDLLVWPKHEEVAVSHGRGSREHILVREGRALIGPLDEAVALDTGDYITFSGSQTHRLQSLDGEPARLWLVHTIVNE